jgi:hypothetical protein
MVALEAPPSHLLEWRNHETKDLRAKTDVSYCSPLLFSVETEKINVFILVSKHRREKPKLERDKNTANSALDF